MSWSSPHFPSTQLCFPCLVEFINWMKTQSRFIFLCFCAGHSSVLVLRFPRPFVFLDCHKFCGDALWGTHPHIKANVWHLFIEHCTHIFPNFFLFVRNHPLVEAPMPLADASCDHCKTHPLLIPVSTRHPLTETTYFGVDNLCGAGHNSFLFHFVKKIFLTVYFLFIYFFGPEIPQPLILDPWLFSHRNNRFIKGEPCGDSHGGVGCPERKAVLTCKGYGLVFVDLKCEKQFWK